MEGIGVYLRKNNAYLEHKLTTYVLPMYNKMFLCHFEIISLVVGCVVKKHKTKKVNKLCLTHVFRIKL